MGVYRKVFWKFGLYMKSILYITVRLTAMFAGTLRRAGAVMFSHTTDIQDFSVDPKYGDIRVVHSPDREVRGVEITYSSLTIYHNIYIIIHRLGKLSSFSTFIEILKSCNIIVFPKMALCSKSKPLTRTSHEVHIRNPQKIYLGVLIYKYIYTW